MGGEFAQQAPDDEIVKATGWTGTPAEIEAVGGSTMPLEALNMYRQRYIDAQGDYTLSDGRVIPAVYAKVRTLLHTYGVGIGNTPYDSAFDDMMTVLSEEDAENFLKMPWGQKFRPMDLHARCNLSIEEAAEFCERLAKEGYLFRVQTNAGNFYHQMPYYQGVSEIRNIEHMPDDPDFALGLYGSDAEDDRFYGGSSVLVAIPVNKEVVAEGGILPYDDIEQIIEAQETFAIAPCACRHKALCQAQVEGVPTLEEFHTGEFADYFSPLSNRRVETCFHMGDEAKYHISIGHAREITKEQALEYMKRSVEDGFILQKLFSKDSQTICSCDRATCLCMLEFTDMGIQATESRYFDQSRSRYELLVDYDACLKCGACAERCPMEVISMGEDGYPVIGDPEVGDLCFRCGQCAHVCPAGARTLVPRPAEELLEEPQDIVGDHNLKAACRFEHGMIF